MKLTAILLVVLPLTLAAPTVDKRFVLDTLAGIINTDALKGDLQLMVDAIGSDPTEQLCEQECHTLFTSGTLMHSCPLICHGFQDLVNHFSIVPDSGSQTVGKRLVLDTLTGILNTDALKTDLQEMVNAIGSDPTEQLCEQECHKLLTSGTLMHSCPLICHGFQDLVNHFSIVPDSGSQTVGKRLVLDTLTGILNTDALKTDLQAMVNAIGSDPTEQLCEQECHKLLTSGTLMHSCPLICHGFQDLVNHFSIVPDSGSQTVGKRLVLDTLTGILNTDALKTDLQAMVNAIGSDPTEQLCEQECHTLFTSGTLMHSCPLICHGFQDLVNHFSIVPDSGSQTVGKRLVLDTLTGILNTDALKTDLQVMVDAIGSDPTEQLCEQECHKLLTSGTLMHSCPLICHGFQDLVNHFSIVPDSGSQTVGKRLVLDTLTGILNTDALKTDLQMMVNAIGSDPTEQLCEQECHKLLTSGTLMHSCPLICHGFQDLVNHFSIVPDSGSQTVGKRLVLDTLTGILNTDALKTDLQAMVNAIGSDPTEQLCEQECHKLLTSGTLMHSCPLICHGFQDLVNHFSIVPDSGSQTVGKRLVLDTLTGILNTDALKTDLQAMVNAIGSDPTEQLCEQECHTLFTSGTLMHSCPLICHGFQDLVNHFSIVPDSGSQTVGKRLVLDTLTGILNTDALKTDLQVMVDTIGSDPTEQLCEQECHKLLTSGTLMHSCPLICHGFQDLVNHFSIVPDSGSQTVGKRLVLDTLTGILNTDALKTDLQEMVNAIGSDPTEQLCEQECHKLLTSGTLMHSCPLICHGFQDLVNHFSIVPDSGSQAVGKRFV